MDGSFHATSTKHTVASLAESTGKRTGLLLTLRDYESTHRTDGPGVNWQEDGSITDSPGVNWQEDGSITDSPGVNWQEDGSITDSPGVNWQEDGSITDSP
ncbi:hypothetical protein ACOMHN_045009 [Nucella lapillus]